MWMYTAVVVAACLFGRGRGNGDSGTSTKPKRAKIRGSSSSTEDQAADASLFQVRSKEKRPRSPTDSFPTYPPFTFPPTTPSPTVTPCEYPDPERCGCATVNQADYRGSISVTAAGIECQRWDSQTPHQHWDDPSYYSDGSLEENYCRNPHPWMKDAAWCYTTNPSIEWAYCDVPTCLPPTVSPRPTSSSLPSYSPTRTQEPSDPPTSSSSPTVSALPSSAPSSSPTFSGGCMDLTMAFLLPPKTYEGLELSWRITTTRDEEDLEWGMAYHFDWRWPHHHKLAWDGPEISSPENSIMIEHTNGTNSMNEIVCLPEGPYELTVTTYGRLTGGRTVSGAFWEDGVGVNSTFFVLSSNGNTIASGDLLLLAESEQYDRLPGSIAFDLPAEMPLSVTGEPGQALSLQDEFKPLQCFRGAFNYTFEDCYDPIKIILREAWLDENGCGPILEDACKSDIVLGFADKKMEGFCEYHQCAYHPFLEGGGDYHASCECIFHSWDCQYGSDSCDEPLRKKARDCCKKNPSLENSCECLIEPQCESGNAKMCQSFASSCCNDDDCSCDYMSKACRRSLQEGVGSIEELLNLRQNPECIDAEKACCEGVQVAWYGGVGGSIGAQIDVSTTCGCDFWGKLCTDFQGPACDFAAGRCCGSLRAYGEHDPFCYCEFNKYADSLGYELEDNTCADMAISPPKSTPDDERLFLVEVFHELNGTRWWLNNAGWFSNQSHCTWFGVSCSDDGLVTGIDLSNNNVTGYMPSQSLSSLYDLKTLKLGNNTLSGTLDFFSLFKLRNLQHIDLSMNNLSGEIDFLGGAVEYLNFSDNAFTTISPFQEFKGKRQLHTIDLSFNNISQDVSGVVQDLPPNLKELVLTDNSIHGTLPDPLPALENLRRFVVNNNMISGTLPDISRSYPRLRVLDVSNQSRSASGGLSGNIPAGLRNLQELIFLDLSFNKLTGRIPPTLGYLPQLKALNVSSNMLSDNYIPTEIGSLAGILEVFNASGNMLQDYIPSELGRLDKALILLSGNADGHYKITPPAPLSLCNVQGFDLKNDLALCPLERNALKDFYEAAKGQEWTDQQYWLDEYRNHCLWHGIKCGGGVGSAITELNLTNNGLSGRLNERIAELHSLEILDVNDNDIKGTIPNRLGMLSNLTHLRLSYNAFVGTIPTELGNLQHLELLHIHGNRLSGEVPADLNTQSLQESSSFISDCGVPSDFDDPLMCSECTICCNANGECHSTELSKLEQVEQNGFDSYAEFIWVFLLLLLGYICVVITTSYLYDRFWRNSLPRSMTERSKIDRDKRYALDTIGANSVYAFFLSKSWVAWGMALAVLIIQVLTLIIFVGAAVKDFTSERSDYVYSWRCPRNSLECYDDSDLDWQGWTIFAILMASHLSKDIINGIKLLLLCGKRRHSLHSKIRFFVGGMLLTWIAAFTLYASTVYNIAIARSNTEVIVNAVIILFIIDMDEQFYNALKAANSFWVGRVSTPNLASHARGRNAEKNDDMDSLYQQFAELKDKLQTRDAQLDMCLQHLNEVRQCNEDLEARLKNLEGRTSQDPLGSPDQHDARPASESRSF